MADRAAATAVIRTLYRLHLRYRERDIEDWCIEGRQRMPIDRWYTAIAAYVRSMAGRTSAALALRRAGFHVDDFSSNADQLPLVADVGAAGPMRSFKTDLLTAVPDLFTITVVDGRLGRIQFNADAMWPAFLSLVQPSAFARLSPPTAST
jgi:hypothetical protein